MQHGVYSQARNLSTTFLCLSKVDLASACNVPNNLLCDPSCSWSLSLLRYPFRHRRRSFFFVGEPRPHHNCIAETKKPTILRRSHRFLVCYFCGYSPSLFLVWLLRFSLLYLPTCRQLHLVTLSPNFDIGPHHQTSNQHGRPTTNTCDDTRPGAVHRHVPSKGRASVPTSCIPRHHLSCSSNPDSGPYLPRCP